MSMYKKLGIMLAGIVGGLAGAYASVTASYLLIWLLVASLPLRVALFPLIAMMGLGFGLGSFGTIKFLRKRFPV